MGLCESYSYSREVVLFQVSRNFPSSHDIYNSEIWRSAKAQMNNSTLN